MSHTPRFSIIALAACTALALAAPAGADTLVQDAAGARNLAAGGGYLAWAAPAGDRWRLTLRAPDGTVTSPAIASFGAAPDPAIGSDRRAIDGRRLLVVYSRCTGSSIVAGCDVYALDVRTGKEEKVKALATTSYSETMPQLTTSSFSAIRRGGPRPGVYSFSPSRPPRRLTTGVPFEIAASATRVVSVEGQAHDYRVVLRQLSGDGRPVVLAFGRPTQPRSLVITRYRAGWLVGTRVFQTTRFGGSGGPFNPTIQKGNRLLPESLDSIATDGSNITRFLDGEGVNAISPPLFAR